MKVFIQVKNDWPCFSWKYGKEPRREWGEQPITPAAPDQFGSRHAIFLYPVWLLFRADPQKMFRFSPLARKFVPCESNSTYRPCRFDDIAGAHWDHEPDRPRSRRPTRLRKRRDGRGCRGRERERRRNVG